MIMGRRKDASELLHLLMQNSCCISELFLYTPNIEIIHLTCTASTMFFVQAVECTCFVLFKMGVSILLLLLTGMLFNKHRSRNNDTNKQGNLYYLNHHCCLWVWMAVYIHFVFVWDTAQIWYLLLSDWFLCHSYVWLDFDPRRQYFMFVVMNILNLF